MSDDKSRVIDIASFQFKKKRGRPKKFPDELSIHMSWVEYDYEGTQIPKEIIYKGDDWHALSTNGCKIFVERCFQVIGALQGTDPYFARELEERLKVLYYNNKNEEN